MQIKYIGNHRPTGMIVDVDEDVARDAIKSGEFEEVGKEEIIENPLAQLLGKKKIHIK